MIDKYGIDDKRDAPQGIKRLVSGFRVKNSRMVVSSGIIIVYPDNTNFGEQVQSSRQSSVTTGRKGREIGI
jgi:hypothetical protein